MFTSVRIKNFRGFKDFTIGSLDRVNLITGANGVGKTALLEALFVLIGETNLSLALRVNALRGLEKMQGDAEAVAKWVWQPLFHSFETAEYIEIEGKAVDNQSYRAELRLVTLPSARIPLGERLGEGTNGQDGITGFASKALEIQYSSLSGEHRTAQMVIDEEGIKIGPPPPMPKRPGSFLSTKSRATTEEDAKCYGQLEVEKEPYDVLKTLKLIEPRLVRLAAVAGVGGTMLWGDIGLNTMAPLALMGDGLSRITAIVLRIATSRHGFVLIDEIESGFHYSTMRDIWSALADAARRFDVQLFATTHSWECIQAAHEAFAVSPTYDFRLHRLDRLNGEIRAVTYDHGTMSAAIASDLEVR
jgi:hypothetical protein